MGAVLPLNANHAGAPPVPPQKRNQEKPKNMQIDLRVPPCAPVNEVAKFIGQCEAAGFDGVGILDSQMLERDVFVSMGK